MQNEPNAFLSPGHAELILKRKKSSWLHSFRDVVQKGALQAKATVDAWRGEQATVSYGHSGT